MNPTIKRNLHYYKNAAIHIKSILRRDKIETINKMELLRLFKLHLDGRIRRPSIRNLHHILKYFKKYFPIKETTVECYCFDYKYKNKEEPSNTDENIVYYKKFKRIKNQEDLIA